MSTETRYPEALSGLSRSFCPDGTVFYWQSEMHHDADLLKSQQNFAKPAIVDAQKLLKQARQRFIYRQPTTQGRAVVFKLFPLRNVSSRLRHRKYAYREFVNTLHAEDVGVAVPSPLAFLEKRAFSLVNCSGLVLECLDGYSDLLSLYQAGLLDYKSVSEHAAGVILKLYALGVNHIDLRDENMMLNTETGDLRVIDWQYATFLPSRAPWLLEYLSAYFIHLAPENERDDLRSNWLPALHDRSGCAESFPTFQSRLAALDQNHPRVRQRLALRPVGSS